MLEDPDSQSPDIGPPPVSRFENEDPIAFNSNPSPEDRSEDAEPTLSVNLETRKKRRESGPKSDLRRVSIFESPPDSLEDRPKGVRIGAKRKFSVQEDEDKSQHPSESFTFTRRSASCADNVDMVSDVDGPPQSPERPILGSSKLQKRQATLCIANIRRTCQHGSCAITEEAAISHH